MPTCQKQDQLCRCIDWHDEDFDVEIDHFIQNFEFLRVNWSTLPWMQGSLSVYAESAGAVYAEAVCAAAQPCPLKKQPEN